MSDTIDVRCDPAGDGWTCRVTVTGRGSATTHEVRVSTADLGRLDPGAADPAGLVDRSFRFLLAREPKEAILHRFELPVIARYFPEYDREIGRG